MVSGQAVTREGFGKITGTYHQTVLTALAKALDRFNQSCEVCICTEDDFVLNMLERNLAIWAGNEFLTSKRKPVANQQEWMEIWRLSNRHLILTEPGKHEYTGWLQGEIGKPTKNGTKMTFAPVRSTKKYEAEMQQILEDGKKLGLEFGKKEE